MSKPKPAEHSDAYLNKRITDEPPRRRRMWLRRGSLGFFLMLGLGVVVVYSLFAAPFLEWVIKSQVKANTTGSISLDVKQASLFRGFVFENIVLQSGEDFKNKPLLEVKRLTVLYNVYGFWVGDFGIHEIGLYQPRIYLRQKKNRWNFETLAKPGSKEEKKEEPEEEAEAAEPRDSISTLFSMRAFLKFVIEDLYVMAESDDASTQPIEAEMKNFTFRAHVLSKEFDEVPLGLSAVKLFDTILFQLNPQKKLSVRFKSKDVATKTKLNLHWLLAYDGHKEKPRFNSQLIVGDKTIPLTYRGRHKLPLNFNVDYKLDYNTEQDLLTLDFFRISVLNDTWLQMQGNVKNVTGQPRPGNDEKPGPMHVDLKLDRSDIRLSRLYPLYRKFTGDRSLRFGGNVSLAPLAIEGTMNNLNIDGKLRLRSIRLRSGAVPVNIPFFDLSYQTALNLESKSTSPLGLVRYARVGYNGRLNGARLKARVYFNPGDKTDIDLAVLNLAPSPFIPKKTKRGFDTEGRFDLKVKVRGPRLHNLTASVDLSSKAFHYLLNRGKSGLNRIQLNVNSTIKAPSTEALLAQKDINVKVKDIDINLRNKEGKKAFWLDSNARVNLRHATDQKVYYEMKELAVHFQHLRATLPEALQEQLEFFNERIYRRISLYGETNVKVKGKSTSIDNTTRASLYDWNIHDITLRADARMKPGEINIKEVSLIGLNKSLDMNIHGSLREKMVEVREAIDLTKKPVDGTTKKRRKKRKVKAMVPDIHARLSFGNTERKKILQDNFVKGRFKLAAHYKDTTVKGSFEIDDFNYENTKEHLRVNQVNMNFPFLFNTRLRKALNLTAGNKERLIKNYNFSKPFNFTVDSVEIRNPVNKQDKKMYKLIYPQGDYPGIGARIEFKDNVFEIPILQVFTLNGLVTMQDSLFNLGTINKKYMEFIGSLQVKEVDLKLLIDQAKSSDIEDGKIGLDMSFQGRRLDKRVIDQVVGYISVYKIGEKFGSDALKMVSPKDQGLVKLIVNNSVRLNKLDLKLSEGLVYAEAHLSKEFFGRIIAPAKNEIKQSRIPITEFFQNLEKEASVYAAGGSPGASQNSANPPEG